MPRPHASTAGTGLRNGTTLARGAEQPHTATHSTAQPDTPTRGRTRPDTATSHKATQCLTPSQHLMGSCGTMIFTSPPDRGPGARGGGSQRLLLSTARRDTHVHSLKPGHGPQTKTCLPPRPQRIRCPRPSSPSGGTGLRRENPRKTHSRIPVTRRRPAPRRALWFRQCHWSSAQLCTAPSRLGPGRQLPLEPPHLHEEVAQEGPARASQSIA